MEDSEKTDNDTHMNLDDLLNIIPYIPYRILKDLEKTPNNIGSNKITEFYGSVLFFDIVQFANLVFSIIENRKHGVEQVNKILSGYFTELIHPIRSFGGTVYQFAGDSILVGFEKREHEDNLTNIDRTLSAVSEFFMNLEIFNRDYMREFEKEISVRIGIGFGSYTQIILGSDQSSFKTSIIGEAVEEAVNAEKGIQPNKICISKGFNKYKQLTGKYKSDEESFLVIDENYFESVDFVEELNIPQLLNNKHFLNECKSFINNDVLKRVMSGYEILNSEHREITCLLLNFTGDKFMENIHKSVDHLNEFYSFVQVEADRYGGVLLNPDLSDKGNVLIIILGAPIALEQKELLASQLALKIKKELYKYKYIKKLQIGISTGRAYCGDFGTSIRKDYSVIGNVINISARLMVYSNHKEILLDARTQNRLPGNYQTQSLGEIQLKGILKPISIHKLLQGEFQKSKNNSFYSGLKIIGRDSELGYLADKYLSASNGNSSITGIIADAGVGKTLLVSTFLSKIDKNTVDIFVGKCFLFEKNSLFYVWQDLFSHIIDYPQTENSEEIINCIKEFLLRDLEEEELHWIPLFIRFMGFEYEEDEYTLSMSSELKEAQFFNIIYKILVKLASEKTIILFFEDIHWIDDKSRDLLKYIIGKLRSETIQVVYTSRTSDLANELDRYNQFEALQVNNLDREDAIKLIRDSLKLQEPNSSLENQILKASQCNPFFIDTIIKNIKDSNDIYYDETGTYYMDTEISNIDIPDSISNVILSRIDNLSSVDQLIIKTASVIGQNFTSTLIINLLKKKIPNEEEILQSIETLITQDLMVRDEYDSNSLMFKHMLIRDIVNKTLMQSTKLQLNTELAGCLEESSKSNIYSNCERIAHYYFHGEHYQKAYKYYLLSAQKAENLFASNDIIYHYQKAIEASTLANDNSNLFNLERKLIEAYRLTGKYEEALLACNSLLQSSLKQDDQAIIYKELGHIYQEKGLIRQSLEACEKALELLGNNIPSNKQSIYLAIIRELMIRGLNDNPLLKKIIRITRERNRNLLEAELLFILSRIYYFENVEKLAWTSIKVYNISEHLDDPKLLSMGGAYYGLAMMSAGLKKIGYKNMDRAMKLAQTTSNPLINAITQLRKSLYYLYFNEPYKCIELLKEAITTYRNIGEMWELMTSLGALGQTYYNICDFENCVKAYSEVAAIATQLDSVTQKAWSLCRLPLIDYLQGELSYENAVSALNISLEISETTHDMMNIIGSYSHLMEMAVIDKRKDDIKRIIPLVLKTNSEYLPDLPHVRNALIFALEGSIYLDEAEKLKVAKKLLPWLTRLSIAFKSLRGPIYRAKSIYYNSIGRVKKSRKYLKRSIRELENTPYRREYAKTLMYSYTHLENSSYREKALDIYRELNIKKY